MKTGLFVIAAIVVSLAAPGCTGVSRSQPKTIDVSIPIDDVRSQKVITREIALAVGDTLKLSLGSNHTTPYRWTADTKIGDPTVVQQTSHEYVAPSNVPRGRVGVPGTEVWTFKALQAGTTTIATDYLTSTGTTTPACSFTAKVTVQ